MTSFSQIENDDTFSLISLNEELQEYGGADQERLQTVYTDLRELFIRHDYNGILLYLPKLTNISCLTPIIHLIIGCAMIRVGRSNSGFTELALAIRFAMSSEVQVKYLTVLAVMFVENNDKESFQGCLCEILDISRIHIESDESFELMKTGLLELEKKLFVKLDMVKNHPVTCKSFPDQIMELNRLKKYFDKETFSGKCQLIVNKIMGVEFLLEKWNKDGKPPKIDPLKYLLEAILAGGPEIAYAKLIGIQPMLNQYMRSLENTENGTTIPKSRSVSLFHKRSSDITAKTESSAQYIPTPTKIAIINSFICMLRCQYQDASLQLNQCVMDVKDETQLQLKLWMHYCQMKESTSTKKDLLNMIMNLEKVDKNCAMKYYIMAKVYQKLYYLDNSFKHRKRINGFFRIAPYKDYMELSIKSYITAITLSPTDDLYIPQMYEEIIALLVSSSVDIRIVTFFVLLRNYFANIAQYNYLHIPELLDDYTCPENATLIEDVNRQLNHSGGGEIEKIKEFYIVSAWINEYKKEHEMTPELTFYYATLFARQ
ncbi:hypothetical protein G210_3567 [Candida maltosa Xu316]|uniref:Uncharacterized protein n=1 Tax=Candida maltosa (strain Xu316) TaxID=1245528 RepID=M3JTM0_CANMX|nr:hypothetical protein G210_3567 [Candida maltosa Xu316]